jgi:squalene synthase HpnC
MTPQNQKDGTCGTPQEGLGAERVADDVGKPQNSLRPEESLSQGWARLPDAYRIPAKAPEIAEARAYCARLARSHYENFSVATWFLPKRLHQDFFNVYAYCRISDDLGDEVGDPRLSLGLLNRWEEELDAMYGRLHGDGPGPTHPVFVALEETVRKFAIPQHEFSDLLTAFRQDQTVSRYERFGDLLGYCHNSANPVGHLVLYLGGYADQERQQLSDYTCTALQLANFWQDVGVDFSKGRIYIPLEDMRGFGVDEAVIAEGRATPGFLELMEYEVARAREWFARGLPLESKVSRELALDIELFTRGGQAILKAIEDQGYDVLRRRPTISKARKLALLGRALLRRLATHGPNDHPGKPKSALTDEGAAR